MKTFHRIGWGSWIRTSECQCQRLMPSSRLAIPQYPDRRSQACGSISSFDAPSAHTPSLQHASYRREENLRHRGLCSYLHYTPILKSLINFLQTVIRTAIPVQTELGQLRKFIISTWWELNPRTQLGRLVFYHWTTRANWTVFTFFSGAVWYPYDSRILGSFFLLDNWVQPAPSAFIPFGRHLTLNRNPLINAEC